MVNVPRATSSSRRLKDNTYCQQSMGSIRIISGLWRGRKLPVHHVEGLRPTTDRVKETLFNWLAQDIPHSRCLDLFAGSGSLGFEAASRQAESVTLVEMNSTVFKQLQTNTISLKASNITVINDDALSFLKQIGSPYQIVFIDPPFHKGLLDECVMLLEQNGWLADGAMIYIETEKGLPLTMIPEQWRLHRNKTAGQVSYSLFERKIS